MISLKEFGLILKYRRDVKLINQTRLSHRIKISQGTISKIETGDLEIGLMPLQRLWECELISRNFEEYLEDAIEHDRLEKERIDLKNKKKRERKRK